MCPKGSDACSAPKLLRAVAMANQRERAPHTSQTAQQADDTTTHRQHAQHNTPETAAKSDTAGLEAELK